MGSQWYYADSEEQRGPVSLQELKVALAALPDARHVLVWRESLSDWIRAEEVPELKAPPPLPVGARVSAEMPTWKVKWWWYPVALAFFGPIGSLAGRQAMAWVSGERKKPERFVGKNDEV